MEHCAGIDVPLGTSSMCDVDAVVREAKVPSEPKALIVQLAGSVSKWRGWGWR